jgi:hypothetical protein
MAIKYVVSTTLGDSILDPGNHVYAQVSPSKYLRKSVADVNVGDMILYQKPYTKTDLDDVAPYLERSPRYTRAKELLHEENSRGDYVPRLRTLLLRGLAEHGVISDNEIEAKVLYETTDFTKAEYEAMEDWLVAFLSRHGIKRSESGVGNWLKGETLAPRTSEWEQIFKSLEEEVNPDFREFHAYSDDPTGVYFNYRLYTVIRQGIMRYLNDCRGTHKEPIDSTPTPTRISLSPEYAIVFQHFMNDKDQTHATARVTGIEAVKKKNLERVRKENQVLGDGVVKKELERMKDLLKGYGDLLICEKVLEEYTHAFLEDYPYTTLTPIPGITERWFKTSSTAFVVPSLIELFGEGLDEEMSFFRELSNEGPVRSVESVSQFIDYAKRAFLGREMDSFFSYQPGTSLTLLESFHRTRKAIPKRLFRHNTEYDKFRRDITRDRSIRQDVETTPEIDMHGDEITINNIVDTPWVQKRIKNLRKGLDELERRYGLSLDLSGRMNHMFLSETVDAITRRGREPVTDIPMSTRVSGREYIEGLGSEMDNFLKTVIDAKPEHIIFMERSNTRSILDEFGLGHILDRRWQDFLWEDL